MVSLLHTIASQNYSIGPNFLNITAASIPVNPAFEAPLWALRVNGLWFASLIVSLATASLGMLVQSWLREYLAEEWISPQEKLRARQYRHPAMEKWKVFEIAAALPLLLQIALGLFFLGLCFFTAAIDSRMGNTSLPLVTAWAFFFFVTTVAPLVSPRCPFKVRILKHVMRLGRRYPMRFIFAAVRSCKWDPVPSPKEMSMSEDSKETSTATSKQPAPAQWLPTGPTANRESGTTFASTATNEASTPQPQKSVVLVYICGYTNTAFKKLSSTFDSLHSQLSDPVHQVADGVTGVVSEVSNYVVNLVERAMKKGDIGEEEEDAVQRPEDDVEALLATDRIMDNDGLLDTMRDAVQQSAVAPAKRMQFIIGLLKHRGVPSLQSLHGQGSAALSRRAYSTLIGIVIETLRKVNLETCHSADWFQDACQLLAADGPSSIATLADDDAFVSKICRALSQSAFDLELVITFVLRVVKLRCQENYTFVGHVSEDLCYTTLASTAIKALETRGQSDDWIQQSPSWAIDIGTFFVQLGNRRGTSQEKDLPIFEEHSIEFVRKAIALSKHDPHKVVIFASRALAPHDSDFTQLSVGVYVPIMWMLTKAIQDAQPLKGNETWIDTASHLLTSPPPRTLTRDQDDSHRSLIATCDAINISNIPPERSMDFVWRFLDPTNPNMNSLTRDSYIAIIRVVLKTMTRPIENETVPEWLQRAISLLCSDDSLHTIPFVHFDDIGVALEALRHQRESHKALQALLDTPTAVTLVLRTIRHCQRDISRDQLQTVLSLDRVPSKVYTSAIYLVSDALRTRSEHGCLTEGDQDSTKDAVILLLSNSPNDLPSDVQQVLFNLLNDTDAHFSPLSMLSAYLVPGAKNDHRVSRVSKALVHVYNDPRRIGLRSPLNMYNDMLSSVRDEQYNAAELWLALKSIDDITPRSSAYSILEDLWNFIYRTLPWEAGLSQPSEERPGVMQSLWIVARLREKLERKPEAAQIMWKYWSTWAESYRTIGLFTSLYSEARIPDSELYDASAEAFRLASPEGTHFCHSEQVQLLILAIYLVCSVMLTHSADVARLYVEGHYDDTSTYDALDLVRFTLVHVRLYERYAYGDIGRPQSRNADQPIEPSVWTTLWGATMLALQRYEARCGWETVCASGSWHDYAGAVPQASNAILENDRRLAGDALQTIYALIRYRISGKKTVHMGDVDFPEELVASLKRFSEPPLSSSAVIYAS